MKVTVTGVAGHFGSFLAGRLLTHGIEVVGVDTLLYGEAGLQALRPRSGFRFEQADICDGLPPSCDETDAVVHLAALVGPVCERDPQRAWQVNRDATALLCDWAARRGVRLLFASTCSNYGVCEGMATEETPLRPLGVYAQTKVAAEERVAELGTTGVTLRFGTLAGISPRPRFDTLLNQLTAEACVAGRITCYRPQARRPFTHLDDASQAVLELLTRWSSARHRCYNIVGFNTTVRALAEVIQEYTHCDIQESPEAADGRDYAVSAARVAADLGVRPRVGLAPCVQEVCAAIRSGAVTPKREHYNVR